MQIMELCIPHATIKVKRKVPWINKKIVREKSVREMHSFTELDYRSNLVMQGSTEGKEIMTLWYRFILWILIFQMACAFLILKCLFFVKFPKYSHPAAQKNQRISLPQIQSHNIITSVHCTSLTLCYSYPGHSQEYIPKPRAFNFKYGGDNVQFCCIDQTVPFG